MQSSQDLQMGFLEWKEKCQRLTSSKWNRVAKMGENELGTSLGENNQEFSFRYKSEMH